MDDKELIKGLYIKYWNCMMNKDAEGLKDMMAEDYFLHHMTGVKQSREEFLEGLTNGTFNYYSAAHDSIEVSVHKDTAEMTGKSLIEAAVYGGGRHMWRLRGDFRLRREQGEWKFVSSRASTY